jgi:hypothetical protein
MTDVKTVATDETQTDLQWREKVLYPWLFDEILPDLCDDNLDPLRTSQLITCVYRMSESHVTKYKITRSFFQAVGCVAFYLVWKSMGIGYICQPFRTGDITIEEVNRWTDSQYNVTYLKTIEQQMLNDERPNGPCSIEIAKLKAKK